METIYGYLDRIVYYNEENSFIIAKLQEKGKSQQTTIVGNLAGISSGIHLKLTGKWVHNKKFGEQFQVNFYEITVPATVKGIEKYLGSGLIKGIGPVMSKRIVKHFRENTIDIIDKHAERLAEVEGIGIKRVAMIQEAWAEQKHIKDIMMFLQEHGVSAAYSAKIYKTYGQDAIKKVTENPYQLAADIKGIGFVTADRIAFNLGIDPASVMRAAEGFLYVLFDLMNDGHVYFPYEELVDKTVELLGVDREIVLKAVAGLFESKRIVIEDISAGKDFELKSNQKAVYLPAFYNAETYLALNLRQIKNEHTFIALTDFSQVINQVEYALNIKLAEKQKEAVISACRHKVLVITGGPGTGKTTIIRAILAMYTKMGLRVMLAAPTGRAAKRMQEATAYEARTIHRLLEYSPGKGGFQKNRENLLKTDALILDEASMIDSMLMYNLVRAVPPGAFLIMVGDVNQLPSVGPGNVLHDITQSGQFDVVTLNEIFRQSQESKIITNAHCINQGKFPDILSPEDGSLTDFYFINKEEPDDALETIISLCKERVPERFGFHPVRDIQVIAPMHKGLTGVANLNMELQNALNPGTTGINVGSRTFRLKDKVIQLENNYDKEVYNGDLGWITDLREEDREIIVNFDGKLVTYDYRETDEITLAYAISVHKSQGSEYPVVIMPVMTQHYVMLQRNLIYTGITRGKKLVIIVGTKKALSIAIKNNRPRERYTMLKEKIADMAARDRFANT